MHMVCFALVEASTQEHAVAAGRTVFDRLVGAASGEYGVFDYYVTFDEEEPSFAGTARWGDLPVGVRVGTSEGDALVERGWQATEEEFLENIERVRTALGELSNDEIMEDEQVRHAFHQLGVSEGPPVYLYDEHGTGIRNRSQLERVLATGDRWIVPADVHY